MAKALRLFAVHSQGTLAENAPLMLHTRFSEMLAFSIRVCEPENIIDLHNMRIAAKRLRYTLEIYAPAASRAMKRPFATMLDTVKSIQEQIGEIHDCDVRIERISAYLRDHVAKRPEIRVGLERLVDRESLRRAERYQAFVAFWKALVENRQFETRFLGLALAFQYSGLLPDDKSLTGKSVLNGAE